MDVVKSAERNDWVAREILPDLFKDMFELGKLAWHDPCQNGQRPLSLHNSAFS